MSVYGAKFKLFLTLFCHFSAENANKLQGGEEGPRWSGWFEDGPGKAPRPSNGRPTWPSGNPGLSCNWNESPREETNFPQMEKAEPLPPENGPWLYNRTGLLAPVHADPEDRTSLVISSSGLPDISNGYSSGGANFPFPNQQHNFKWTFRCKVQWADACPPGPHYNCHGPWILLLLWATSSLKKWLNFILCLYWYEDKYYYILKHFLQPKNCGFFSFWF